MNTCYFEQKIAKYTLNILNQYPHFITYSDMVKVWHKMFTEKELKLISKEISKLAHSFSFKEKNQISNSRDKVMIHLRDLDDSLLDQDSAEDIFLELKHLPKEKIKKINSVISNNLSKKIQMQKVVENSRIKEVKHLFKMNDAEIELLTLYFCAEFSESFGDIVQRHVNVENITYPAISKSFISNITQLSNYQIMQSLKKASRLVSLSILENGRHINMSDEFIDYLSEFSTGNLIEKYAKKISTKDSLELTAHLVPSNKIETLRAILESDSPSSILFHGKPGTGKTELAKSVAKEVNLDLYAINILDEDGADDLDLRKRSLYAVQNHPTISENIILVDECDQLINSKINFLFNSKSGDDQKAWINEYFDTNRCKTIWITNTLENIDESIVRRFNYILEFDELSNIQRERIIKTISDKHNCSFLNEEDIKQFSKSEKLTSGHFSIALKTVQNLKVDDNKKKDFFSNILTEHQKLLGKKSLRLKSIHSDYCIKGLNIDQSPINVIEQSKRIIELIETNDSDINLNTLLYGPPGTGKTEFVKYLGQELGKEILFKRASDLLSMWVGGSEKNIRHAFEEAEKDKKILFIDEADSLLSSRDGHQRTWETTQVNEILTCMENFKGILLCATNHVENLDMAAQRRFLFKLKFDYLDKNGIRYFYDKFFSKYVNENLTADQIENLGLLSGLTPSDFNNLKRKFEITKPHNHEEILKQLQIEVDYKKILFKKKVGIN